MHRSHVFGMEIFYGSMWFCVLWNFHPIFVTKRGGEMAAHSRVPVWRSPWTAEPGRLVHGVAESRTRLSDYSSFFFFFLIFRSLFWIYFYVYCDLVKVKTLSRVRLFATPWTVAYQAPSSMEFSRQEYWSGVPYPSPAIVHSFTVCAGVLWGPPVLLWL